MTLLFSILVFHSLFHFCIKIGSICIIQSLNCLIDTFDDWNQQIRFNISVAVDVLFRFIRMIVVAIVVVEATNLFYKYRIFDQNRYAKVETIVHINYDFY